VGGGLWPKDGGWSAVTLRLPGHNPLPSARFLAASCLNYVA